MLSSGGRLAATTVVAMALTACATTDEDLGAEPGATMRPKADS